MGLLLPKNIFSDGIINFRLVSVECKYGVFCMSALRAIQKSDEPFYVLMAKYRLCIANHERCNDIFLC